MFSATSLPETYGKGTARKSYACVVSERLFRCCGTRRFSGGLAAVSRVLSELPPDFPAAIIVLQHLDRHHRSSMAEILSRRTVISVQQAQEGDRLRPGIGYVAPPNRHLLVNLDGTVSLSQSELVHFVRPSADLLFESLAGSDFLQREVVPRILKARESDEPIRIWSAGCASGEEAYSVLMVFAEAMGIEAVREKVKIYATDVDEEALNVGRQASYSAKALEPVSDDLKKKYFDAVNHRYVFRPDLRRSVIFGRHDLIKDAPISRLDLLVCRNTLMYFTAETQAGVLSRFHFALNRTGFLFLGKAELLLTHARLFIPLDMKNRLFIKVETGNVRDRLFAVPHHNHNPGEPDN